MPILVTLFGMVTEARLVQPSNALFPILGTLFGMVTEVRDEQNSNALLPILVTLYVTPFDEMAEGMTISDFKAFVCPDTIAV